MTVTLERRNAYLAQAMADAGVRKEDLEPAVRACNARHAETKIASDVDDKFDRTPIHTVNFPLSRWPEECWPELQIQAKALRRYGMCFTVLSETMRIDLKDTRWLLKAKLRWDGQHRCFKVEREWREGVAA